MADKKILIVEDNKDIAQLLNLHLTDLKFKVDMCLDGTRGLQRINTETYDLVILDLMLPGSDGITICKAIRSHKVYVPILMLTAKDSEIDRVMGLETGADDYVTKPFSITEVLARIKAILRRSDAMNNSESEMDVLSSIDHGLLKIFPEKHQVNVSGNDVELTSKEFDLLLFFSKHPGRVFTRGELLDQVWGYGHDGYEHTVNSHINRLRVKIESNPKQPVYIQTIWGVGYKFSDTLNHD